MSIKILRRRIRCFKALDKAGKKTSLLYEGKIKELEEELGIVLGNEAKVSRYHPIIS